MRAFKQKNENPYFVYGFHTALAVLNYEPERAKLLYLAREKSSEQLAALATKNSITIQWLDRLTLEKRFNVASGAQGVVLVCKPKPTISLAEVLTSNPKRLLVLDSMQDSVNIGRAARAAKAFKVDAIILCKDRSADINAHAEKAAVGALSQVKVCVVVNLARALEEIKAKNIFVYGADEKGEVGLAQCDFAEKVAIVIGQEGSGIRPLVKKSCDVLVNIPTDICLNAADAALLFLYQLSVRQNS